MQREESKSRQRGRERLSDLRLQVRTRPLITEGSGHGRVSSAEEMASRFMHKALGDVLRRARRTPSRSRFLPPADDDPQIALGMHNTHAHPLHPESWPFCRLRICLDRIPQQEEGEQSFQLLPREMS